MYRILIDGWMALFLVYMSPGQPGLGQRSCQLYFQPHYSLTGVSLQTLSLKLSARLVILVEFVDLHCPDSSLIEGNKERYFFPGFCLTDLCGVKSLLGTKLGLWTWNSETLVFFFSSQSSGILSLLLTMCLIGRQNPRKKSEMNKKSRL